MSYLEKAGRTAAEPSKEPCAMYPAHTVLAHDIVNLIVNSQQADLAKRSLFYRANKESLQKKADGYHDAAKKLYKQVEDISDKTGANPQFTEQELNLIHAALGLFSEAGEILENVMGRFVGDAKLDLANVKEEVGDVQWYAAMAARETDATSLEEIQESNIAKLAVRYPDKFTSEAALNRNLDAEKIALAQ